MTDRLDGRTAIVTAASRGIGRAIAEVLAGRGARVVITGRTARSLDDVVDGIGSDHAVAVVGDAHDTEHQMRAVGTALDRFGSLDILVNNVGTPPPQLPLMEMAVDDFRATIDANVVTQFAWIRAAWRGYMAHHGGSVLNVSSVAGLQVVGNANAYGVGKAAVVQLTKQAALELAPGVRVNAIAPGFTRTAGTASMLAADEERLTRGYPLGRLGEAADMADAAAFLVSDAASWITGQTLAVDGGKLLLRG
jgi:NAD(P)-dependent dehydrogenase (short-subunit alcohol dehydrogenase family)